MPVLAEQTIAQLENSPKSQSDPFPADLEESSSSSQDAEIITQEDYEVLAKRNPDALLELIERHVLEPPELTFAAEAAGGIEGGRCVAVLMQLLEHSSPVVREGAIYGLSNHLSEAVSTKLRQLSQSDISAGVREAARETLDL